MVPFNLSSRNMLAYLVILVCLSQSTNSEQLHDIWHHDQETTRVGATQKHSDANASSKSAERVVPTIVANKTIVRGEKLIEIDLGEEGAAGGTSGHEDEKCDFKGEQMRIAVSPQPPFVSCLQDLYGDWLCNGSNIEVIHVLERRLNFRARWVVLANGAHDDELALRSSALVQTKTRPPARGSGRLVAREHQDSLATAQNVPQTSGIFNLVATGRVLMSANGVMRTLDRSGHNLIVSQPFDAFKLHFLLSKSVRDHDHIFIKPFDSNAWLAILSAAALIVPIFYLINSTSAHYSAQDDHELRKLSLWQFFKWKLTSNLKQVLLRTHRKRLSSTASLDQELNRVFQLDGPRAGGLDLTSQFGAPHSNLNQLDVLRPRARMRGESRRRRRLLKRQWAYERRKALKVSRRNRKSGFFKVAYIIWYVVASLANQGGETEDLPRANSTRILVAFWWLYLIVICAIHSGILTAILTFPKQSDFIQTLDDYLNLEQGERDSLRLSVDKFSELAHLLVNFDNLHKSPLQVLQNLSVPISYVNFQRHRQRILDDIQQGRSAFMEEKSTISQIISQEYFDSQQSKCLFKSSRYPIDVIPMSLILSNNMPASCVELVNKTLARIMKMGLAQKWRRNFEAPGNDCLNTVVINAGDVDKIELKQVMLAVWLLWAGFLIGLLFLIAEIIWLFMVEDDDDEDDDDDESLSSISSNDLSSSSSSSGESSPSDESDRIRLGFRRALMPSGQQLESIRSLKAKRMTVRAMLRKTRRQNKRTLGPVPKIILSTSGFGASDDEDAASRRSAGDEAGAASRLVVVVGDREGFKEVREIHARHLEERRARRLARGAQRRARRIQKTVDLFKRLHGGKIYSSKFTSRVRRMSHSVMSHLAPPGLSGNSLSTVS